METDEAKNLDPFNEFNKKLDESIEKGRKLSNAGRGLTESGQYIVDFSQSVQNIIQYIKPVNRIEELITNWDILNGQIDSALDSINSGVSPVINSTSGSVTVISSDVFSYENMRIYVPCDCLDKAEQAVDEINQISKRIADKKQVASIMREFNLDKPFPGEKSPLELFLTAHNAFEIPVNNDDPVGTSLIPIRESINSLISHLLRERPNQEPCKNEIEKIKSIGKQLKKESLAENVIISLADQWHLMKNEELSPSKNKLISRKEWQYRLNRSTIFIESLLNGLDVNKLKSRN